MRKGVRRLKPHEEDVDIAGSGALSNMTSRKWDTDGLCKAPVHDHYGERGNVGRGPWKFIEASNILTLPKVLYTPALSLQ